MPAAIPDRVPITLRLDKTAHTKAKTIARKEDRFLNSQIEHWIKKAIEVYENENGEIEIPNEE